MDNLDHVKFLANPLVVPQTVDTDFGRQPVDRNKFISGIEAKGNDPSFYHLWKNELSINHELRHQYLESHNANKLNGDWLYLGVQVPHFGHLLAESMHRTWAWGNLKSKVQGVIVLTHPNAPIIDEWPPHTIALFDFLNIPLKHVVCINHLTEVEGLYVPEQGACLSGNVQRWYNDKILDFPFLQEINKSTPIKKLYVSRSNYRHKGRVAGLAALEELLIEDGYTIIKPETLPILEQLTMVHNAEKIIFEEGSAIHLLEMLPRQTGQVFYITRRPNVKNFLILLSQKYDHVFSYGNVVVERFSGIRPNSSISYLNDPNALLKQLQDNHFLTSEDTQLITNFSKHFLRKEKLDNSHYFKKNEINKDTVEKYLARYEIMCILRVNKFFAIARIMFDGFVSFRRLPKQVSDIIKTKFSDLIPHEHKQVIAQCLVVLADRNNNGYSDEERFQMKKLAKKLSVSD